LKRLRILSRATVAAVVLSGGCAEHATAPSSADVQVRFARAAGGGISIKSAVPASAQISTTLTVQVNGSGFTTGSKATWALDGDTAFAVTKIKTNSTTFVSATQLTASITISGDASIDLYDIIVITPTGKKGIGIELFAVTPHVTLLPVLSGYTVANAMNSSGIVVGYVFETTGKPRAVRWTRTGSSWSIDPLPASDSSVATSVNASGSIVGTRSGRAIVWASGGGTTDVGPGQPTDINGGETIVGAIAGRAVAWQKTGPASWGPPQYLPTLNGISSTGEITRAVAINDSNRIVGLAFNTAGTAVVVMWAPINGAWAAPVELRPGTNAQYAADINADGDVAGTVCSSFCPTAAFFSNAGGIQALPNLGNNSRAYAINGSRQIVGWARLPNRGNSVGGLQPVTWIGGQLLTLPLPAGSSEGQAIAISETGDAIGEVYGIGSSGRPAVWTMQ